MRPTHRWTIATLFALISLFAQAQHPANTNGTYQLLRNLQPGGDVLTVNNLILHRDAASLTFRSGSIALYGEVAGPGGGKVTGAVFRGEGHLHIAPPTPEERHNLNILTKSESFDEDFDTAVLRFTDSTASALRAGASGKGSQDQAFFRTASDFRDFQRLKLQNNFDLRLLEDVLSPRPTGSFFLASIHGKKDPHLLFVLDPTGAWIVSPEEVELMNWSDWGMTLDTAFHLAPEYTGRTASGNEENNTYVIDHTDLETGLEKNGFLTGTAKVTLHALTDGVAVIPLNLYPTLRVSGVEQDGVGTLDYIQEKKEEDADLGVILAHPLKKNEKVTLIFHYSGKDVVVNEGGANYYPIARENWYPSSNQGLGNYATYNMLFHVPKGLQLIATGTKLRESTDGHTTTSEWRTDTPIPVAGFNVGDFTEKEAKLSDGLLIDAYANTAPSDFLGMLQKNSMFNNINTVSMLGEQLYEGQAAAALYEDYFGQLKFPQIALTQQAACNYGQSWPMLVYLPVCGFFDSTQQHFLGLHPEDMYWKTVTPHEVAHQWWGQTVGFRGYRDQWMSEGFADASASIFLQATRKKNDDFRNFWKEEHRLITERNAEGFRPIDVGPVTMGYRLNSPKTGNIARSLIYPKGAYILHMIRMMMWNQKTHDEDFKATMHDFLEANRTRPATTEDFKAAIERHMTPAMDLDGNHRMDWFFNEYVYGTDLPEYQTEADATPTGQGYTLHLKVTQRNVPDNFQMLLPVYLELEDGRVVHLGRVHLAGNNTLNETINLPKMPSPVRHVLFNYYYDALAIMK